MVNQKGCEAAIKAIAEDRWMGEDATRTSSRAVAAICRAIGSSKLYCQFMRDELLLNVVCRLHADKQLSFSKMKDITPYAILRKAGDRYGPTYLKDSGVFDACLFSYRYSGDSRMLEACKSYMEALEKI